MKKIILQYLFILIALLVTLIPAAQAMDRRNRMGVGMSNQLVNSVPALSVKLQKSKVFAMGGLIGFNTSSNNGGYGGGLKIYRIIFEEPQLNFYTALLGALTKDKTKTTSDSGFQIDWTLGSEFSFSGLESLGFSFEFGLSMHKKKNDLVFQTVGHQFLTAAVHFYL